MNVRRHAPVPSEVLVRVRAAGLNRADLLQRRGGYPAPAGAPADIPGMEFAGEIAALGAGVTGWREGDRVMGIVAGGAQAEYLVSPAAVLAAVPASLDWPAAGAVPEAFITAHDALVTQGTLSAGDHVVIHAVGSGVGLAGAQIVRACGAHAFGTTRTADKLTRAREFGAEAGAVLAGGPAGLAAAVRSWTGGDGAALVLDLVGGDYVPAGLAALAPRGQLILVGLVAGRSVELDLGVVLSRRLTVRGTVLRGRSVTEKGEATAAFVRDVVPLLADGRVQPVIDSVLPLDRIVEAHERLERNETFGKIVMTA